MAEELLIRMKNISKNFGFVRALESVDFDVHPNEILGLVGENGAGKSTLIKILVGVYPPDKGEMFLEGEKVNFSSPGDARKKGIEPIYQDLALFEEMSIERNIFAGREPTKPVLGRLLRFIDKQKMRHESVSILEGLDIKLESTKKLVKFLSGGQRQTVAIGRALCFQAKVLVMDEPTASLGINEANRILELVKRLKEEEGISVILISHNLPHVFSVADRFIVLRLGKVVGNKTKEETNIGEITALITGSEIS